VHVGSRLGIVEMRQGHPRSSSASMRSSSMLTIGPLYHLWPFRPPVHTLTTLGSGGSPVRRTVASPTGFRIAHPVLSSSTAAYLDELHAVLPAITATSIALRRRSSAHSDHDGHRQLSTADQNRDWCAFTGSMSDQPSPVPQIPHPYRLMLLCRSCAGASWGSWQQRPHSS